MADHVNDTNPELPPRKKNTTAEPCGQVSNSNRELHRSDALVSPDAVGAGLLITALPRHIFGPVLELGAGDGRIALAAAKQGADPIVLVELDPCSAIIARQNLLRSYCTGKVICGDYFMQLKLNKYGPYVCVLANPPQLPTQNTCWSVRDCGGRDGLTHFRRVAQLAGALMAKNGALYLHVLGFLPIWRAKGSSTSLVDILRYNGLHEIQAVKSKYVNVRPNGAVAREIEYILALYGKKAFRISNMPASSCSGIVAAIRNGGNLSLLRMVIKARRSY